MLVIACANIANLLLARGSARRHELSVRVALGASRWRIAQQLLVESMLLSAAGAVLGSPLRAGAQRFLSASFLLRSPDHARCGNGLDGARLYRARRDDRRRCFSGRSGLRATRVQPNDALKEQGRSIIGESRFGFGSLMVILQVALSLVLVVGAGLFVRTFTSLNHVRLGFNPDPLLIVEMNAKRSSVAPDTGRIYGSGCVRRRSQCPACRVRRSRTSPR